ncbi:peptidylprolyl isomerase [Enhydrobacter aerosaccus]|uniref:Peptidyl-prolyl cis-trans isomerase n=1 Tax=Enhydrobacter aerosaccus TaxID=225324 RepID=A0A1T4JP65_9HYPH|nr:peptidylprolyl isomerase [Enhydrobacter aerosaccus]SJZ31835.1 peptidylprolyl isomerase [Enhydrobacter aerosaccus]
MRLTLITAFIALFLASAGAASAMDPENTLYIDLKDGRVVIEMRPDLAPKHVAQIKKLALEHKYDGIVFHRVIDGFMAQTGDPTGTGSGGMGEKLPAEFNKEPHTRGAVSMARTNDPDSARSQFFIVLKDSNFLDGQYTVWGRVVSGMEFVDKIKKGAPGSGAVSSPDKMIKVRLASDPNP